MTYRKKAWVITADWYDKMRLFASGPARTRQQAINEFIAGGWDCASWREAKRDGWRCVRAEIRWPTP